MNDLFIELKRTSKFLKVKVAFDMSAMVLSLILVVGGSIMTLFAFVFFYEESQLLFFAFLIIYIFVYLPFCILQIKLEKNFHRVVTTLKYGLYSNSEVENFNLKEMYDSIHKYMKKYKVFTILNSIVVLIVPLINIPVQFFMFVTTYILGIASVKLDLQIDFDNEYLILYFFAICYSVYSLVTLHYVSKSYKHIEKLYVYNKNQEEEKHEENNRYN